MKGFPHTVTIKLHKDRFREMMTWLHDQDHKLRETMAFGKNHHISGNDFVTQQVCFKVKNQAMMFKLAWGGR